MNTSHRVYLILSGTIFLLVGMLHLCRLVFHWPIVLGPWIAPYWVSFIGCPVATGYSIWAVWLYFHGLRKTE